MAVAVWLGMSAATKDGPLNAAWFDAMARYESQADGLRYETNARRAQAAAMARSGP